MPSLLLMYPKKGTWGNDVSFDVKVVGLKPVQNTDVFNEVVSSIYARTNLPNMSHVWAAWWYSG